ncbi:DNA-binding protein [Streptomyces olivaceoviridis]
MTATTAPITPLTPGEKRIAEHLIRGLAPDQIATHEDLAPSAVKSYLRSLRTKLHCPRAALHILVHAILSSGQVTLQAIHPAPAFSVEEIRLLRALAAHQHWIDVAKAARIASADVNTHIEALVARAGVSGILQLVVLGHAWQLLGPAQAQADTSGAGR